MAYMFDGDSRLIVISAQTLVSVRDIYSRWVDWLVLSDNSKYLPAFATVGGNPIDVSAGTSVPVYAYLQNAWRVRPQESDHTLVLNDGVLLVDGGGDPFVNTIGDFVVRVNYQQPVQAITVATGGGGGGLTLAQDQRLERIEKLLRNKTITNPATGVQTVYEDDGTTVFVDGNLFEDAGGAQLYRGQGAERRERLQ